LLAAATVVSAATLSIRNVCCLFVGWQGVELSAPAPTNGQAYVLQYRTSLNTNWRTETNSPIYGPGVEDGVWYYSYWHIQPPYAPQPMRFWRLMETNAP
jgi:hypothetical protein